MLGYQELIVIFLIVLLFFGGSKIPELARGLGKGVREFKKAKDDLQDAIEKEDPSKTAQKTVDKKDPKMIPNDKNPGKIA